MGETVHEHLSCGLEYGVIPLPDRHVVSFQIRLLAGTSSEPPRTLGLSRVVEETLDKGTEGYTARELADAFDAIGAGRQSGTGRETMTFTCTILPEHFERAIELHAELLRRPTFPEEAVSVNVQLAKQELIALDDDAQGIVDKLISRQAYGPVLGRHALGEPETLDRIARADLESFWRTHFHAGRLIVSVAGAIEPARVADALTKHFDGFGRSGREGRGVIPIEFTPRTTHHDKALEQEHIAICWPGVDATHDEFPVQQVTLGILSGGMSGRLFTEVREKRGLVYHVSAHYQSLRDYAGVFTYAGTTPAKAQETFEATLAEIRRLGEGISPDEMDRSRVQLKSALVMQGESTGARASALASDWYHLHRLRSLEEISAAIDAVRGEQVIDHLRQYPPKGLSVLVIGPQPLNTAPLS